MEIKYQKNYGIPVYDGIATVTDAKPKKNNWFKRLICKHAYEYLKQYKINGGMEKHIDYICKKCGKVKTTII